MEALLYSLLGAIIVSLISFIGILILLTRITQKSYIINILISFAAGALIGDAFLHLFPEYIEIYGYTNYLTLFLFAGIILMLTIESYFHSKHSHSNESVDDRRPLMAKLNLISDGFHNFLDGIAIGASFLISPMVGAVTVFAIILHEIPQELADTSILLYSGWRKKKILLANFLTALTSVAGVLFVFLAVSLIETAEQILIPLAIGQFLYISLATLVPEIHRKVGFRKYIFSLSAFCLGILIMFLLTYLG